MFCGDSRLLKMGLIDIVGLVALSAWDSPHLHVGAFLLLSRVFAFMHWCVLFSFDVDIVHKRTAWLEGSCLSELETLQY